VACTFRKEFDAVFIFSQDQDLSEAVREIKDMAKHQGMHIKVYSVFPTSDSASALKGLAGAIPVPMDKAFYDSCLDPRDYRPAKFRPPAA
jgi:hypothetical protein